MSSESMESFIQAMPKIELHAHLFGCIRVDTLNEVLRERQSRQRSTESHSPTKFEPTVTANDLKTCFDYFRRVYEAVRTSCEVNRIMREVLEDFAKDGVKYLELRTSIKAFEGMSTEEYVESLMKHVEDVAKAEGMIVKIILSVNRCRLSSEEGGKRVLEEIAAAVDKYPDDIVGIDISGTPFEGNLKFISKGLDELMHPTTERRPLKLTVHISEAVGLDADTEELLSLKPHRLGHCCYMSDEQFDRIIDEGIPVELCPTSNSVTMGLTDMKDHHFEMFWKRKHTGIAICTDDTGLFDTTLTKELMKVAQAFPYLTKEDMIELQVSANRVSFNDDAQKEVIESIINEYKQTHMT